MINKVSNWKVSIEEISIGVYKLSAIEEHGRKFEKVGYNVELLKVSFKAYMSQIDSVN